MNAFGLRNRLFPPKTPKWEQPELELTDEVGAVEAEEVAAETTTEAAAREAAEAAARQAAEEAAAEAATEAQWSTVDLAGGVLDEGAPLLGEAAEGVATGAAEGVATAAAEGAVAEGAAVAGAGEAIGARGALGPLGAVGMAIAGYATGFADFAKKKRSLDNWNDANRRKFARRAAEHDAMYNHVATSDERDKYARDSLIHAMNNAKTDKMPFDFEDWLANQRTIWTAQTKDKGGETELGLRIGAANNVYNHIPADLRKAMKTYNESLPVENLKEAQRRANLRGQTDRTNKIQKLIDGKSNPDLLLTSREKFMRAYEQQQAAMHGTSYAPTNKPPATTMQTGHNNTDVPAQHDQFTTTLPKDIEQETHITTGHNSRQNGSLHTDVPAQHDQFSNTTHMDGRRLPGRPTDFYDPHGTGHLADINSHTAVHTGRIPNGTGNPEIREHPDEIVPADDLVIHTHGVNDQVASIHINAFTGAANNGGFQQAQMPTPSQQPHDYTDAAHKYALGLVSGAVAAPMVMEARQNYLTSKQANASLF